MLTGEDGFVVTARCRAIHVDACINISIHGQLDENVFAKSFIRTLNCEVCESFSNLGKSSSSVAGISGGYVKWQTT
jgi:hypothetical protein